MATKKFVEKSLLSRYPIGVLSKRCKPLCGIRLRSEYLSVLSQRQPLALLRLPKRIPYTTYAPEARTGAGSRLWVCGRVSPRQPAYEAYRRSTGILADVPEVGAQKNPPRQPEPAGGAGNGKVYQTILSASTKWPGRITRGACTGAPRRGGDGWRRRRRPRRCRAAD